MTHHENNPPALALKLLTVVKLYFEIFPSMRASIEYILPRRFDAEYPDTLTHLDSL
jgi:hypothetical protein